VNILYSSIVSGKRLSNADPHPLEMTIVLLFNELQRSNQELTLAYNSTLEGWSLALDLRDVETQGHTRRVADLTLRLA